MINIAVDYERSNYRASLKPEFSKDVSLAIKPLLISLKRMKIANMWQNLAKSVKICFIETPLAKVRSYETLVNEMQVLRTVDINNSDVV